MWRTRRVWRGCSHTDSRSTRAHGPRSDPCTRGRAHVHRPPDARSISVSTLTCRRNAVNRARVRVSTRGTQLQVSKNSLNGSRGGKEGTMQKCLGRVTRMVCRRSFFLYGRNTSVAHQRTQFWLGSRRAFGLTRFLIDRMEWKGVLVFTRMVESIAFK